MYEKMKYVGLYLEAADIGEADRPLVPGSRARILRWDLES